MISVMSLSFVSSMCGGGCSGSCYYRGEIFMVGEGGVFCLLRCDTVT